MFGVTYFLFRLGISVQQAFYFLSSYNMLLYNFFGIFGGDLSIESVVRNDFYDRTFFTKAKASGRDYFYFVCYSAFFKYFVQIVSNKVTGRCFAARTSTDQNLQML